ncbi:MAG: hypothetical protein AB7F65_03610 [Dehalococcoidia bacterium]
MDPHRTSAQRSAIEAMRLAVWTLAWVATLALARFGPERLWDSQEALSWAAISLNLGLGAGWILAHARYLRGLDELQRKILLDAMALTLGTGMVLGFASAAADHIDLVALDADVGFLAVLMAVTYIVTVIGGHLRYR